MKPLSVAIAAVEALMATIYKWVVSKDGANRACLQRARSHQITASPNKSRANPIAA
jgi:hypothetical protein